MAVDESKGRKISLEWWRKCSIGLCWWVYSFSTTYVKSLYASDLLVYSQKKKLCKILLWKIGLLGPMVFRSHIKGIFHIKKLCICAGCLKNYWKLSFKTQVSCQTQGSHFNPNTDVALHQQREGRFLWQTRRSCCFFKMRTLGSHFNFKTPGSVFQHKRGPMSSAFQRSSKVYV